MGEEWTPELVRSFFCLQAAEPKYGDFFKDDGGNIRVVRTLLVGLEWNLFNAAHRKQVRVDLLRNGSIKEWREQVYKDVAWIINNRSKEHEEANQ